MRPMSPSPAAPSSPVSTNPSSANAPSSIRRLSDGGADPMTERQNMLRTVQMHDFALLEAAEYLDAYPQNADALAYFKTQQALYQAAVDAYTQKYGPLQYKNGKYDNMWSWVSDPWPWEGADQ
ncbi:hypothetical protein B5F15_11175 [Butyricicoccus pullicaecorum]|nr:hypothetical protein B5F15_11175 [Butyricicoccus pullicaecorum]